jgi:hypothetical protein
MDKDKSSCAQMQGAPSMSATGASRSFGTVPAPPSAFFRERSDTLAVANEALRSGFVLLPRTILHAAGLSRDAKLLYAVLLSYAWQESSCFPGYERLQRDLGCGKNQVTKYMRELEDARLISRHRRGLGRTNLYTIHDLPKGDRTPGRRDSSIPNLGTQHSLSRRRQEHDSAEQHSGEQQQARVGQTAARAVVALLVEQGVTERVAADLVEKHDPEAIREQVDYHAYRPSVTRNPAGALVKAIRERWAPPEAWLSAKEHAAALRRRQEQEAARAAEEEARRHQQETLPPEIRVQGQVDFWVLGQRRKGREPSANEVATKQSELIAGLASGNQRGGSPVAIGAVLSPGMARRDDPSQRSATLRRPVTAPGARRLAANDGTGQAG